MKKFSILLSKKYFFIAASIVALVAYSFVVYAAAPTGGYLPSDHQLDPSCAPGDTDCFVTLPSAVIDGVVQGGTAGSVLFVDGAGHLSEDNSRFFYDASNHRLGLGTTTPSAILHVVAASTPGTVDATTYTGTGLDDATFGGHYTGTQSGCSIMMGIASLGTGGSGNDEFIYGYSDNACGSGSNTPIEITPGVPQDLGNGITVTFTNGTGHTAIIMSPLNNYWMASLQPPVAGPAPLLLQDEDSNTLFKVSTTGKVTIGGVEYTFPGSAPASNGYVLSSTTSGVLSWVAAGGSSLIGSTSTNGTETWLGEGAGDGASSDHTVMIGFNAGLNATSAASGTFIGYDAGNGSTNSSDALFMGVQAGKNVAGSSRAVLLGYAAGSGTSNTQYSVFIGSEAGKGASDSGQSIMIGDSAGYGAYTGFTNIFIGTQAGYGAHDAISSTVIGAFAGQDAYSMSYSVAIGASAAGGASGIENSFIGGVYAASNSSNLKKVVIVGRGAGSNAGGEDTVIIGDSAGGGLGGVKNVVIGSSAGVANFLDNSILVGYQAGFHQDYGTHMNVIGANAGASSSYGSYSVFIGEGAGQLSNFASNSIFIGTNAGYNQTLSSSNANPYDDISTFANTSILIGHKTSTGGFSNSIAMGAYATNTASNQFLIGSTQRPIDQFVMVGSGGTSCSLDANGTACSSDQRLKTNITDLNSNVLDSLLKIKTVTFNWMSGVDQDRHIGFIAQDMQQYFPELVSTGSNGYLQVNYAGMTPVIVEAIRELNLKIANITTIADAQNQTLLDKIRTWLADTANGIEKITSREIDVKQLCVSNDAGDKTCLTKEQVDHLLGSTPAPQNPAPAPQNPDPVPTQDDPNTDTPQDNVPVDTIVDSGGDEAPPVDTGDVTPPDENPPQETPTPDPLPQL